MNSISIATIQTDLFWEDKAENLKMLSQKTDLIQAGTQLILLPEMFSTGFSMKAPQLAEEMDGITLQWMKKTAAKKNAAVAGSVIIKEQDNFYNRLVYVLPNGDIGTYDKRHLFSFGEEQLHYSAGTKRLIASLNGWKINFQICYDLRFPVWARQNIVERTDEIKPEYDILVYVANWPEKRIYAWKTLLVARAIENQCYVIGVNRVGKDGKGIDHSGGTMVIDPLGEILFCCDEKEDIHHFILHKKELEDIREKFRFLKDGDEFMIS